MKIIIVFLNIFVKKTKRSINNDLKLCIMKHSIIVFMVMFMALSSVAQSPWQQNGDDIYYNNGKVGIGTSTPDTKLHLSSEDEPNKLAVIKLGNQEPDERNFQIIGGPHGPGFRISNGNDTKSFFAIRGDGANPIHVGLIGIGTNEPFSKLQIEEGDIYITEIGRGVIMKSPNGQCWRFAPNDNGNLMGESIDCPSSNTSVKEIISPESNKLKIFPNPTKNKITLKIADLNYDFLYFEIYDIAGKLIIKQTLKTSQTDIDIAELRKGAYIFKIKTKEGEILTSEKIIKN